MSTSTILPGTLWTIWALPSVKRKAGGRYAADLALQLPGLWVRFRCTPLSCFDLIGSTWRRLASLHASMANPTKVASGYGVGMDPTIPWFSHRCSPIMSRKIELIPHVSQRHSEMINQLNRSEERRVGKECWIV